MRVHTSQSNTRVLIGCVQVAADGGNGLSKPLDEERIETGGNGKVGTRTLGAALVALCLLSQSLKSRQQLHTLSLYVYFSAFS